MTQPPSIEPATVPGPDFDPMDRIVEDLQNIESFLLYLSSNFQDTKYLNSHLSSILGIRRTLSQHIDMLSDDPYNYPSQRLKKLHQENEDLFIYIEGVAGEMLAEDEKKFKKCIRAAEEALSKLDDGVTP
jgi:hypothetical protein